MTTMHGRASPASARARPAIPASFAGFTAIELLVVMAIIAIVASIAMPSFVDFTVTQRIRMAGYDLVADLSFARGEAIKRNGSVLVLRNGSSWAAGWCVTQASACSGVTPVPLRTHPALDSSVTETGTTASVTFGLDGRTVGITTPPASITFDDAAGKATIKCRKVYVDASGRPRAVECT